MCVSIVALGSARRRASAAPTGSPPRMFRSSPISSTSPTPADAGRLRGEAGEAGADLERSKPKSSSSSTAMLPSRLPIWYALFRVISHPFPSPASLPAGAFEDGVKSCRSGGSGCFAISILGRKPETSTSRPTSTKILSRSCSLARSRSWSSMFWISRMWFLTIIASISSCDLSFTRRFIACCTSLPCCSLSWRRFSSDTAACSLSRILDCSSVSCCSDSCVTSLARSGSGSGWIRRRETPLTARSILSE
mmetsp:Transcript_867/g.1794  ORF Transcript_867/g.1794 Transcript_867/m.1794 type:complete len:250 (-) Transcript_867:32-781(-)